MATEKTVYVNPNSSGGDGTTDTLSGTHAAYSSLSSAISGEQSANSDLVSADIWLNIKCGGATADTNRVNNGSGFTTDSTHYVQITAYDDELAGPVWSTSKYRLSTSLNATSITLNAVDNIRLVGLQVENTATGGSVSGISMASNNTDNDFRIMGCYIRNVNQTGNGTGFNHAQAGANGTKVDYFINNIVEGFDTGLNPADRGTCAFYNNDFVGCTTGSNVSGVNGNMYLINNLFSGCGVDISGFDNTRDTVNYNATTNTDLGSGVSGTGNRFSQTFTFLSAGDYHLDLSDIGAKGFGTDLSADAIYAFNTDMENMIRNGTWDIGCSQTIAALIAKRPRSRVVLLG